MFLFTVLEFDAYAHFINLDITQIISSIDLLFLPDWFFELSDHLMFYSAQPLDLFA